MNEGKQKESKAIRQAYGIFVSEQIYLLPEFLMQIINQYDNQNKENGMKRVLRKGQENGNRRNV